MSGKILSVTVILCGLVGVSLAVIAAESAGTAKDRPAKGYAYATKGVMQIPGATEQWKVLLDESNLGGKELEIVELTMSAGRVVGKHPHRSLEIFYVLSGRLGHEVNDELHMLTPGMVGVVRPGDLVRHIVPEDSDVKVLVIWVPGGESKRIPGRSKATLIPQ